MVGGLEGMGGGLMGCRCQDGLMVETTAWEGEDAKLLWRES